MNKNEQFMVEYLTLFDRDSEIEDFYKGVKEAKLSVANSEH